MVSPPINLTGEPLAAPLTASCAQAPHNCKLISDAITAAGVELGTYDAKIVSWLGGWEPAAGPVPVEDDQMREDLAQAAVKLSLAGGCGEVRASWFRTGRW